MMTDRPSEATEIHTRILKCTLEVETSRAYWAPRPQGQARNRPQAFEEYWFGSRSLARIEVLMAKPSARYDCVPECTPRSRRVGGDGPGHPATRLPLACHARRPALSGVHRFVSPHAPRRGALDRHP